MPRTLLLAVSLVACQAPDIPHADAPADELAAPQGAYHPARVIAAVRSGTPPAVLPAGPYDLVLRRPLNRIGAAVYDLPRGAEVPEVLTELRREPDVLLAEEDGVVRATATGAGRGDPLRVYQWNLDAVRAEVAWEYATGDAIVVAVVDTGVTSGPDDGLGLVLPGLDLVDDDGDAADENGHGTHVAGTIAAATDNGSGVAGLAPGAAILPVRVLDAAGVGYTSDVIAGILWAAAEGADVINLSLGGGSPSDATASALAALAADGVVIVAASGNDGLQQVSYPAAYEGVLAVGAVDARGHRAPYANYGNGLDLVAPGGDTGRDDNGDGIVDGIVQETFVSGTWDYWLFQGTSMATPHVSAAAALLLSAGATGAETRELLTSEALDLSAEGWDLETAAGMVDPAASRAALAELDAPIDNTPPEIDDIDIRVDDAGRFVVTWQTDEPTLSRACRAADRQCSDSGDLSTAHEVVIPGRSGALFGILARDEAGNLQFEGPLTLEAP